jgi:hypothetical protein
MPIYITKDENFFKKWSPEMAYILGFFCADGSMIRNKRGAHFIGFQIIDKDLLFDIRKTLNSNHKISVKKRRNTNQKTIYQLQIGSKEIYKDLMGLGLENRKSKRLSLPKIPVKYFSDFIRGYFDGDGNVIVCKYKRKARKNRINTILQSGFISGSRGFLEEIKNKLLELRIVKGGTLYYSSNAWRLYFSISDSKKLYFYIYNKQSIKNRLFLKRKKIIFENFMGR